MSQSEEPKEREEREEREHFVTWYQLLTPEEAGDIPAGHPGYDPDLHCDKYRVISVEMQEQQRLADKKLHNMFVDEPVQDAQRRVWASIPKTNLCIPFNWFDYETDAAAFLTAVAKANNVAAHCVGRMTMGGSLCLLMDSVMKHRHLRMKKDDDPPQMSLQDRRFRHWKAVIDNCCIVKGLTVRLVRHVTLMLVGASFDFARQNRQRTQGGGLDGKIEKLRDWFMENDLSDLRAFEFLQRERRKPHSHYANVGPPTRRRGWANRQEKVRRAGDTYRPSSEYNRKTDTYRPSPDYKREANAYRPSECKRKADTYRPSSERKRKADTYHPSSNCRQKRRFEPSTHSPGSWN